MTTPINIATSAITAVKNKGLTFEIDTVSPLQMAIAHMTEEQIQGIFSAYIDSMSRNYKYAKKTGNTEQRDNHERYAKSDAQELYAWFLAYKGENDKKAMSRLAEWVSENDDLGIAKRLIGSLI